MRSERFNINILSPLKMLDIKAGQKTFIDMSILIPVLFLISIGIVMIASASLSVSEFKYSDRLFFLKRHLFYVSLSLICLYIVFRIPTNVWGKCSSYLILACLFLLGLVLIPGIGIERNGSQRWLNIFGFTFQVSEWVKLSFIIFLAHYINLNKKSFLLKHQPIIKISLLFLVVSALLIAEPDFGSFVLIGFTLISMLFISGIKLRYFISILALVTVSFWILAEISPYRLSRITSYLDPWSEQFSSGYQLTQSLIASLVASFKVLLPEVTGIISAPIKFILKTLSFCLSMSSSPIYTVHFNPNFAAQAAVATPCCPAPVSAIILVLFISIARSI